MIPIKKNRSPGKIVRKIPKTQREMNFINGFIPSFPKLRDQSTKIPENTNVKNEAIL